MTPMSLLMFLDSLSMSNSLRCARNQRDDVNEGLAEKVGVLGNTEEQIAFRLLGKSWAAVERLRRVNKL